MKLVAIMLAALALGAGAFKFWPRTSAAASNEALVPQSLFTVKRGNLKITVAEDGYLVAKNSVNIKPQFSREGLITWLVEEGKAVAEGEVLVEFDKTELTTQIDEIENSLIQYRTELESAKAELEIQKRESAGAVQAAEFALKIVRLKLERYEKGESPNELRKKKLASEKARSEFQRATERFQQVPNLQKEGFLTKIQAEEERIKLRESEINVENADKELELYEVYTDPMEHATLDANVHDGERTLTNAREKAEIGLHEKEGRVNKSEGQVKSTDARLAKLKLELSYMTIKAPRAGIAYYGNPSRPWETGEIKLGSRMRQGNTIITLPDLKEMQVMIDVHEADIDLVKLEQQVLVTIEAFKNRIFEAKVTKIATVASNDWNDSGNRSFTVTVTLAPYEGEMRAGTSAKAEVQVEELSNVLEVPIHAVHAEDGACFSFVAQGQGWDKRTVKIGKNNNHFVEITEGLSEGQQVLLYDPRLGGNTGGNASGGTQEGERKDEPPAGASAAAAGATGAAH